MSDLERAWQWRRNRGYFGAEAEKSGAVRVFHGPGEGQGDLARLAIDVFGNHCWVTTWGKANKGAIIEVSRFLADQAVESAVLLERPEHGIPSSPEILFGTPPSGRFEVREGDARYWISLLNVKHPGLFLDHAPLREWLRTRSRGWRVLNTFAYTGSLSIAAALGEAEKVTTLDLSKPTIQWARDNWTLNQLSNERGEFIAADVFEWLPKLKRSGERFDCVILDPPSFSRGKKGDFSTAKDLQKLHELAFDVLEPGGILITSINSANISWARFRTDVLAAASARKVRCAILRELGLPETFPTRLGHEADRYLKGWMIRAER
ncbi:MAG TPA: class I SAM-dependent methyltransferase [Bdellovibrionota bacterium]|nr:class I SAM-dependent methyltransferase [Bdellovibrionota bacterium]